jgi:Lrp/AsnC family transcriptional regulator for asnA, asnC and gidA
MVHQRINRLMEQGIITGIKPIINEKKIGYDWGSFTGISLNKDRKFRDYAALKYQETECYYITGSYTLYIKIYRLVTNHM